MAEYVVSAENLRTITVVTFILTLLALSLNLYNFRRTDIALDRANDAQAAATAGTDALTARLEALEQRVAELEAHPTATPEAVTAVASP